jgi:hypothetical protein
MSAYPGSALYRLDISSDQAACFKIVKPSRNPAKEAYSAY